MRVLQLLLVSALMTGAALAQNPLYKFDGLFARDSFGQAVSGVGDVNGDKVPDFAVGAPNNSTVGRDAGYVRVVSGKEGKVLYDFYGQKAGDTFGIALCGAGDINQDGFADIVVGAAFHRSIFGVGVVRIFSGKNGAQLRTLYGGDVVVNSIESFGRAVASAGDVNNDGVADIIVGGPGNSRFARGAGSVRVFSGKDFKLLHAIYGRVLAASLGESVSGVGDVDRDGHDDFIVGSKSATNANNIPVGAAIVYSGKHGTALYTLFGGDRNDMFGASVAGGGDVNKDGYPDFLVGIPGNDNRGRDSGTVQIYSGSSGNLLDQFHGDTSGIFLGQSVVLAGDVDGDGFLDILAASWRARIKGVDAVGMARLYSGKSGAIL